MLLAFFFLILNFGISWWNAYAVGKSWIESKQLGGFTYFMSWCGAIMSAAGFTWVYTVIIALILGAIGKLPYDGVKAIMELGYLVIILPVLGSGLAIWLQSVRTAWRQRNLMNIGVAGYNTVAQIYNTYEAISTIPGFIKDLGGFFSDDEDRKNGATLLVILAVLVALFGGALTTYAIVSSTARNEAKNIRTA